MSPNNFPRVNAPSNSDSPASTILVAEFSTFTGRGTRARYPTVDYLVDSSEHTSMFSLYLRADVLRQLYQFSLLIFFGVVPSEDSQFLNFCYPSNKSGLYGV
jgi:hypothetical protein